MMRPAPLKRRASGLGKASLMGLNPGLRGGRKGGCVPASPIMLRTHGPSCPEALPIAIRCTETVGERGSV